MDTDKQKFLDRDALNALSGSVIGAVYEVANGLGAGFLEKVYERALMREFALRGIRAVEQVPFSVSYKGQRVGDYFVDLLVEDALIVELKCVESLGREHMAQCLNYLRVSGFELCLLVNFQRARVEIRRVVLGEQ
ncbi:MAG TPA: GxxExxY protein [Verrucomicrobiae bacterium]|nr:GxxExxY protein [Verrucomicrobiae bacterium]